jgi:iron-sulfur cluster repair protein YtfE (RIC family)
MELETLREELLEQHDQLKRLIRTAKRLSTQIVRGGPVAALARKLCEVIEELNRRLRAHWEYEETVLPPILCTIDAWGPERVARMERVHRAEHRAMSGAMLTASAAGGPKKLAFAARAMADELITHIEDEEKYLLSRSVLTYEIIRVDQPTD